MNVREVGVGDLDRLVALMEGYCDFYETAPGHDALAPSLATCSTTPRKVFS